MKGKQFFRIVFILAFFTLSHLSHTISMPHAASDPSGELVHTSTTDGHAFEYRLIDMTRMNLKNATHHLMVKVTMTSPGHSHTVTKAKAVFVITDPKGYKKKVMGMSMGESFGANIDLRKKGKHFIQTEIVYGSTKLKDTFSYMVE